MPETSHLPNPERRSGKRVIAAGLTGILGMVGVVAPISHVNDGKHADVVRATKAAASERNTCIIEDTEFVHSFGQAALRVSVDVTPNKGVDDFETDTGFGMNVELSDQNGNLASGIEAFNKSRGKGIVLQNNGDANGGTQSVDIPLSVMPAGTEIEIYRLNAVDYRITGPLVSNTYGTEFAVVPCGSLTYDDNRNIAIDTNQVTA